LLDACTYPSPLRFILRLLLILAASIPLFGQHDQQLYQLYTRAQQAQQKGDLQTAAEAYEKIVRLQPELAEAHANLGSIYYQMGRSRKAAAALNKAVEIKPDLAAPYFFLGVIASNARDYEEAIERLSRAARLDPANAAIHLYLGGARFGAGDYAAAIESFEKSARASQFSADSYYHLSKAHARVAERSFEQLQRRHPEGFWAHLARAHYHETRRNWQEAQLAYEQALRANPQAVNVRERLAWVRARAEGGEVPAPAADRSLENGALAVVYALPEGPEIEGWIDVYRDRLRRARRDSADSARKLYALTEYHQALSHLAAAWIAHNDPGSYRAHQLKGQYYEATGKIDEAIGEYRKAIELNPELQNVRFAIGSLLWAAERFDEAVPELEAELRINPNHAEAHYELGDIHYARQDFSKAEKHLLESLRLNPSLTEAHLALEKVYSGQGRLEAALDSLKAAAGLAPRDPAPHYRMSQIYRRLGREQQARRALARFQELRNQQGGAAAP